MKMIRSALVLIATLLTIHVEAAERPLNVLLLYADDWRHDTLGVAGNPVLRTPVLDALAARGVRFTQNR